MKKLFCLLIFCLFCSAAFGQSSTNPIPLSGSCIVLNFTQPLLTVGVGQCGVGVNFYFNVCYQSNNPNVYVAQCYDNVNGWYLKGTYGMNNEVGSVFILGSNNPAYPAGAPPASGTTPSCYDCHTYGVETVGLKSGVTGPYHSRTSAMYSNGPGSTILGWMTNQVFTQTAGSGNYSFSTTSYNNDTGQNPFITVCPTCGSSPITQSLQLPSGAGGPMTHSFSLSQPVVFQLPQSTGSFEASLYLDGQTVVLGVQDESLGTITCGQSPVVCRVDVLPANVDVGSPYFPAGSYVFGIVPLGAFYYHNNVFNNISDLRPWPH
jgi:hypothetical protein